MSSEISPAQGSPYHVNVLGVDLFPMAGFTFSFMQGVCSLTSCLYLQGMGF